MVEILGLEVRLYECSVGVQVAFWLREVLLRRDSNYRNEDRRSVEALDNRQVDVRSDDVEEA